MTDERTSRKARADDGTKRSPQIPVTSAVLIVGAGPIGLASGPTRA